MNNNRPAPGGSSAGKPRSSPYSRPGTTQKPPTPVTTHPGPNRPTLPISSTTSAAAATTGSLPTIPLVQDTIPINDLVQDARKAFSQKEFVLAYQLLTRALNRAPRDINLLDSRAACLEKLGRFHDALTDAKTMIQLYPQSPKAYLRAGKILRLQQNYKSCTKIYVAGTLRCKSIGGKEYETLARLAKDMTATMEQLAQKEARILDPIERLPYELVVMVFESLSFPQRCSCLGVSKKWSSYLGSIKQFWLSIELTKTPTATSSSSSSSTAAYFQRYLLPPPPTDSSSEPANHRVSNKTVLNLVKYTPPKVIRLGYAPLIKGTLFAQLMRNKRASALEHFCLRRNSYINDQELSLFWSAAPKLRVLDLYDSAFVSDSGIISLLAQCPLLEELDISECRITEVCMMAQSSSHGIIGPLVHLKKLVFGRSSSMFARAGVEALVRKFPNLETLDIRTLHPREIQALESLGNLTKLKHLYMDSFDTPSDDSTALVVAKWVEGIPNLESLQLTYCKGVSDEMMRLMVEGHEPNNNSNNNNNNSNSNSNRRGWSHSFKMLNLSYSTYLSSAGLMFMAANPLLQLRTLILNCCGWLDESELCQMLVGCGTELRMFECARNGTISNNLMEQLATSCPNIEVVNVSSSQVTGVGVMHLVNKRGLGLQYLNLDGCQNVSADAIERARTTLGDPSRVSFLFPRTHR
ncbi:hypothetical protein BG004_008479 [Podila humilis]|nr:hypothetical protein BG004_008479 [Podila humilis]